MESCRLRVLDGFDEAAFDHDLGVLLGKSAEVAIGLEPVRAAVEVEQCYVHVSTVNLALQFKVKWYSRYREDRRIGPLV